MVGDGSDLIPSAVRIAVRNAVGGWGPYTVREIFDLFESHGFTENNPNVPDAGGDRRTTAEQFHACIDWASREHARRYLNLVADVLDRYPETEDKTGSPGYTLRKALTRAGLMTADRRLRLPGDAIPAFGAAANPHNIWTTDAMRVFLSHAHQIRVQVSALARSLETYGCSGFVAHDQIEPSRDWQEVIGGALSTCHILVACVTEDFPKSRWADQEVGWALGRGVPIVAVNAGLQPYGFFGTYQSIKATDRQASDVAADVFRAMASACFTGQRPSASHVAPIMARAVVQAFCSSRSYDSTRTRFAVLEQVPRHLWTGSMFAELERAVGENNQIANASITSPLPPRPAPEAVGDLIARMRGESRR